MVGVPGRSKGCHTCLKRRVKCDESKPTCKRCEKAGYTCAGYDRDLQLRFHNFEDGASSVTSTSSTLDKSRKSPNKGPGKVPKTLVLRSHAKSPPRELSLVAFKDDIQFAYLFDNFVWSSYGSPWLQLSAAGKIDSLALEASRAFSLSLFGKHHHQSEIEVSGAVHYDKAVRALSTQLHNVGSPGSETLIVPIMILLMHSSSTPDIQASAFHIQGLLKLIQICGPERFSVEPLRQAFESCRATLITVALLTKSRSFLEQDAWLTVPWMRAPMLKSSQNELVDILVTVPGFLEDQIALNDSRPGASRSTLIRRIENQVSKLYKWRYEWDIHNDNAAWEVPVSETSPHTPPLSPSRGMHPLLFFTSFSQAADISLYNAVLLCLLGILWSISSPPALESLPAPSRISSPLNLPSHVTSLYEPAIEVVRSFEYQLMHVKNCQDSALFWLFPLGLATKILEDESDYMAWISGMLNTSQVTRGYGTGDNTYGFGFYKFPKVQRRHRLRGPTAQGSYEAESVVRALQGEGVCH